jgi:hypothetical protein
MTSPARQSARPPARTPVMTKLLAIGLVILAVLPLVIFATDLPNRSFMRAARQRAQQGSTRPNEDVNREVRRLRVRAQRAKLHVNPLGVASAIVFQLVMLIVIAGVGRQLFSLRL